MGICRCGKSVMMELLRRGWNVSVSMAGAQEIDFVASRGNSRVYVQVCYLMASPETVRREFGALEQVKDNFPKYVVSLDEFDMNRSGIRHLNLRDFLLRETLK